MNQTLLEQYMAVTSTNLMYQRNQSRWDYLLNSYMGGLEYQRGGYLTKYVNETSNEYWARVSSTHIENHCKSVVSTYISFLFREHPDRDYGSLKYDPMVQDFLEDADLDGRSFDNFMKEVATWSSVFGHCWVMMVKPNVGAVTVADEISHGVRPYISLLTPLAVLDWRWTREANGRYSLSYIKYAEEANDTFSTIREWWVDRIETWTVNHKEKSITSREVEVNGLGKIPAILSYNHRSPVRGIGVSDISDIADAQKFIYNLTSEVEQSVRINGHPALVKTAGTEASAGAGAIMQMEDNLDPGLKPYILSVSTDTGSIYQAIQHTTESIDKMANAGSIRSTEGARLSGVAQEQEFQLLNAKLSEKADNLELTEEQIWQLFAEYQGTIWDGEVDYPGSFNIRDTDAEIDRLVKARSVATDPRVLQLIDHELLEALGEDAELILGPEPYLTAEALPETPTFEPHYMVDPETGIKYIARTEQEHLDYAALGYVHKED